jgi:nucleotide-binding universal stress UspA family protein
MLPIRKILCPTDFSQPSNEALKQAVELAEHFGAELMIVHIIPRIPLPACDPSDYPDLETRDFNLSEYEDALSRIAHRKLREIISAQLPHHIQSSPVVLSGDPASMIASTAADSEVDLIVVATHGHTGWRHFVFGSVAEKIVRLSACPVLTIHAPSKRE